MEPNLNDIEDYTKPLSHTKIEMIGIAFLGTLSAYATLAYVLSTLG